MKNLKTCLSLFIGLALLSGCGQNNPPKPATPATPPANPATPAAPATRATPAAPTAPAAPAAPATPPTPAAPAAPPAPPTPTPAAQPPVPGKDVAVMSTTEGDMVIEFWEDAAPATIANFKKLATDKFYDGTAFHRIMKGFMVQGGDPNTKDPNNKAAYGTGDPGYNIKDEFNDQPQT